MENYNYWAEDSSEAIEHHGILGQKWGVRRYQNEDGTLTEEGRKHYKLDKYTRNGGYRVTKSSDNKLRAYQTYRIRQK